jgi:hypothetical protein
VVRGLGRGRGRGPGDNVVFIYYSVLDDLTVQGAGRPLFSCIYGNLMSRSTVCASLEHKDQEWLETRGPLQLDSFSYLPKNCTQDRPDQDQDKTVDLVNPI